MGNEFMKSISTTHDNMIINDLMSSEVDNSYLLLLINPFFTFASMLYNQVGIELGSFGTWRTQYQATYYIFKHWFSISIVVQIVISYVLNVLSGKVLQSSYNKKEKRE